MKKKVFSLMMTLLLAFMGVAKADVVAIGDATSTTSRVPFNSLWGYSFVEQIYTADEIGTAGTINAISFNMSSPDTQTNTYQVFMKNVSRSTFSASTDYEAVTAADMVFSGTWTVSAGWNTLTLDTPFAYDGTSNLLIAFHEYTSSYSTRYFYYTSAADKLLSFHSDSYDPNPYDLGSYSGNSYTGNERANIQIDITPGGGQGGEEIVVEIGDGTSTYYYYPVNMYFSYSLTEQIYTADEIGTAGSITAISFYYDYTSSFSMDNVTLYMKNVTRDAFASNSDMEPLALGDIVWTGTLSASAAGWVTITLDTPFAYDGTSNLLVAAFDGTNGYAGSSYKFRTTPCTGYKGINWYSDSYTPDPYNTASGFSGSKNYTQYRNNIQLSITTGGGDTPDYQRGLHTFAYYGVADEAEPVIDTLYIERPNGAWMEPYHFQLYNDGTEDIDVVLIDFLYTNGYFRMAEGTEYPFTVAHNGMDGAVNLYINTDIEWADTEEINSLLAVNTDERSTHLFNIIATPYQPYCPDVWELAYDINDEINSPDGIDAPISREYFMSEITDNPDGLDLHQNYDLPDYEDSIPDGYDAVLKFKVSKAMMLNARVKEGYENGKVALYTEDFGGEAGPMANNNYTERPFNGGGITPGGSGELTVHDGDPQTTNSYVPVYGFYTDAYLKSEMVYPAVELSDMTGKNINSMKFYASETNVSWGSANFQVFMKEVSDATISAFSGAGTVVYEGPLSIVDGEMTVNFTTSYHYNGGNLLVGFYNTVTGSYLSCSWNGQTITGASVQGYNYNSFSSISPTQRNFLPKTTFAYGNGRSNRDVILTESFENGLNGWTMYNCNSSTGVNNGYTAHSGDYVFRFYYTSDYPQYLISPMLNGTENGVDVSFYYMAYSSSYPETFQVGYSTTTNDVSAFTFGSTVTATNTSSYLEYTESFPAGTKYVAVKCTSDDQFYLFVDDFTFTTSGAPAPVDPTPQGPVFSAGPVIAGLNILPGTYYLVASSTEEDYEVEIGIEELPCPLDLAQVVYPADDADGIQPNSVTLKWQLSPYCTEYRLWFSSTYWPDDEPNNPATILVDWTNNLAEAYTVSNLYNNTNYFWRIDQRTNGGEEVGGCTTYGEVWGFTTKLNIPNLTVTPDRIYEGETVTLNWNHVLDRTYRSYRIYKDGELIHTTPVNEVVTSWVVPASELEYNYPDTYTFNVTAVYDEGESDFSNDVTVTVGGYSATNGINGYVYEQDYTTPIVGATVTITGTDALLSQTQTYTATTNANGYYEVQVYEGTYTSAIATMDGYQDAEPYQNGPTFYVGHNAHHDNMNFMMDEVFFPPVHVCARPMYVPSVEGDTLVQVYWSFPNTAQAFEAQIGEGTSTTGYFPFYSLYNYGVHTTLYTAEELQAAGVTAAPMTSLSWYATNSIDEAQTGITIWMANVTDTEVSTTSPLATGMTKVYTGTLNQPTPTGWVEFVFNEGNFSWDGQSNILILCQRNCGDWTSSIQWQAGTVGFNAMGYVYQDSNPYNVETTTYTLTRSTTRPNIIMRSGRGVQAEMPRSLHHFNIYRTDCYNDGPYTDENTEFLSTAWVPDTSYFDVSWPVAEPGTYKFGVSAVYAGNRVEYPAEERESEIIWHTDCAPCIDKDMQTDITVNVVCNSADSPEGCVVSFTNLNEGEQNNHPQHSITLDDSGFQAITPFRKGDYLVTVYLPGYELLQVEESIWGHRDLRYVLTEIIYNVKGLYVSRTGWAMWQPETWEDYPIPSGAGSSIIDFETGDFNQYNFDNTIGSYHWSVVQEGQDGGYCMKSGNAGISNSTSTIEATVNYTSAGTISFDLWARGESTTDSYDWDVCRFFVDGQQKFQYGQHSGWENYTTDVAAGEHTFRWVYKKDGSLSSAGDCFLVDNINFNIGGSRAVAEERHLEGYKVMCTSIDGEPIFNHNTPVDQPFCQLTTVDPWSGQPMLIEGEHYLVKVATIYSTGESPWCEPVEWVYEPCDHWGPVDEVTAGTNNQGNHIEWVFDHGYNPYAPFDPSQGGEADTFSYDFDNVSGGNFGDWTTFQGTNGTSSNGWMTYDQHNYTYADMGHNGSAGWVYSESYITGPNTAVHPDNYLVSPQVNIGSSSVLNFWVTDANDDYGAEHFSVEVSTASNNTAADFTPVFETTLLSKGNRSGSRDLVNDQVWYNYSVNLGAYAGQQVYIAFHHFNCYDQWFLALDDVELTTGAKGGNDGISHYHNQEIYRQYAEDGIWLNFLGIDNVDFRAYLLYSIVKDDRFSLTAENSYGQFVLNAAHEMGNFMAEFESFYEEASYSFSLLSKIDIVDREAIWKNGVSPADYQSIRSDLRDGGDPNPTFDSATPFCTDEGMQEYQSSYTGEIAGENADYGCVYSPRNPSWYTMRIGTAGPFVIHMEGVDPNSGAQRDIDFVMWGPFTAEELASGTAESLLTSDKIVDCNYSTSYSEDCYLGYPENEHQHNANHGTVNYHVPETGELYVLLITNFSNQPCNITFTKTEGSGDGDTDCDYVNPDILGFLITLDGEYLAFVGPEEREFDHVGEYGDHEYCVRPIYPGVAQLPDSNFYFSMGCPVCASTNGEQICDAGDPIYAEVNGTDDQVHIWWGDQPTPPEPMEPFFYDFEDGLQGWTNIDNDGDTYDWWLASDLFTDAAGHGNNGSDDFVCSFSYISQYTFNADNYLVSPQAYAIDNNTSLSFYHDYMDYDYMDYLEVCVATTTGTPTVADFTPIWNNGGNRIGNGQGRADLGFNTRIDAWNLETIDMSAYAGQNVWIAFHHQAYNQYVVFIDDVTIGNRGRSNRNEIVSYNIYRSEDNVDYALIANVPANEDNFYEYFDAPGAGTYYYQVTALYADGCESDPAISGENPEVDYVVVGVTGIGENSDNVNLFPNPTKGNVTIQAMNMHRITVVSVLGQVVFDTELDQDEYILNMAKFNTGMYMVRVYTDEGVTVKRVTVLH